MGWFEAGIKSLLEKPELVCKTFPITGINYLRDSVTVINTFHNLIVSNSFENDLLLSSKTVLHSFVVSYPSCLVNSCDPWRSAI